MSNCLDCLYNLRAHQKRAKNAKIAACNCVGNSDRLKRKFKGQNPILAMQKCNSPKKDLKKAKISQPKAEVGKVDLI